MMILPARQSGKEMLLVSTLILVVSPGGGNTDMDDFFLECKVLYT